MANRKTYVCTACGQTGHNRRTCGRSGANPPAKHPAPSAPPSFPAGGNNPAQQETSFRALAEQVTQKHAETHAGGDNPPWMKVPTVAALKRALAQPGAVLLSLENRNISKNTGNLFLPTKVGSTTMSGTVEFLDGTVKNGWSFSMPKASEFTALGDGCWKFESETMRGAAQYAVFADETAARKYVSEHKEELSTMRETLMEEQKRIATAEWEKKKARQEREIAAAKAEWQARKTEYEKNPRKCSKECGRAAKFESNLCEECHTIQLEEDKRKAEQRRAVRARQEKDTARLRRILAKTGSERVDILKPDGQKIVKAELFVNNSGQCGYLIGRRRRNGFKIDPSDILATNKDGNVVFCGANMLPEYSRRVAEQYSITLEEAETLILLQDGDS